MMTSKERAELRAQANPLDVTLIVGKGGISDTLLDEAVVLLDSHELVKGRVLETSGLTARDASDAICQALGAEGIACVPVLRGMMEYQGFRDIWVDNLAQAMKGWG